MIFTACVPHHTRRSLVLLRVGACAVLAGATPVLAQQPAGSIITNTAMVDFEMEGSRGRIASNNAVLTVGELLGIDLKASAAVVVGSGPVAAAPFVLTNVGNGRERFVLSAAVEGVSGTLRGFAVDANGNGVFDAGDTLLDGAVTPSLSPGEAVRLLALLEPLQAIPDAAALTISARAETGSGQPGTLYASRGEGGSDAVVGPTTAEATIRIGLVQGAVAEATLVKTQSVWSRGTPMIGMRGAIITYSLTADFTGAGVARGASVVDPIPAGTTFVPGSLTLDGLLLSDAADGDAGDFDGSRIAVQLGDVAGPQTRTIQFKVQIQ